MEYGPCCLTLLADEAADVSDGGDEVASDLEELGTRAELAPPAQGVDGDLQDLSGFGQGQQLLASRSGNGIWLVDIGGLLVC